MFCLCCAPSSGFVAEGLASPVIEIANALKRRAAYDRRTTYSRAQARHPEQTEFVIRNIRAVTMDPHIGVLDRTDIHIRNGEIANLGRDLADGPTEIDGSGLIALPGLVAGHRHLATEGFGFLPEGASLRSAEPRDLYCALRLTLLDLLEAGFTTVHHCAIDLDASQAEAAVLAHIDSGVRGRFSYPLSTAEAADGHDPERRLAELQATWFAGSDDHLVDLGIAGISADALEPIAEARMLPATATHCVAINTEDYLTQTIEAARHLEMDHWIGTLSPGKRADVILVTDTDRLTPSQIDMVCIDGRLRKRNGVLVEPNEGLIRREGAEALARLQALIGGLTSPSLAPDAGAFASPANRQGGSTEC